MYKKLLLILAGLSLLAGCGGGGSTTSGSSPTFNGTTTQAIVTTSNAKTLSADAYTGTQLSSEILGVAKQADNNNCQPALLQEVAVILENAVATIVAPPNGTAKTVAATAQDTIFGFTGSYSYNIGYDQVSGAFSGIISFTQYKDTSTSAALSGSITFNGVLNPATGKFISLNISLNSLTEVYGSKTYGMYGSVVYNTNGTTKSVTMSVLLTDSASGHTYWVKEFTLTLTGTSMTAAGTYYDPIHGYVVMSTITPLTVLSIDAVPTAGQLLFTGRNGTKARLTFTNSSYTVEADAAGNGTYVVVP